MCVVSIILCTRNRSEDLRATLASIGQCAVPADLPAELLIVDNGSTDSTPQVAASAQLRNMPIRYIRENRAGKSIAYNTGLQQAAGSIFLFTDDDVRLPINWIDKMCRPILENQTDATLGSIRMAPHLRRPWMTNIHRAWLLECDFSKTTDPGGLIGANMAFSRKAFQRVGKFDETLGPGALGFCDDALLGAQFRSLGLRIRSADACVEHHFSAARLSRSDLLDRARRQGQSSAHLAYHWYHQAIRFPLLRALCFRVLLILYRLRYLFHGPSPEGAPERELILAEKAAWNLQYRNEARNEFRYPVPHAT